MSAAAAAAPSAAPAGAASAASAAAATASASSLTECRAVGYVDRSEFISVLANLLRSLCTSYCNYAMHTVVLRLPLPPQPGAPPGGTSTLLRLSRRLPARLLNAQSAGPRPTHPFLEDPPERWEVRHEGPPLQGPALNSLPASMREVLDTACYGSGTLDFWKAMGGKVEYEMYREGNEYFIVFHGHEIKVVFANVCMLHEPGVLRDASSLKRVGPGGGLAVEASLLVPEGRHYEGANLLGVFAAQLMPYVKLVRAEVPPGTAASAAGRRK
ncbi:hypothetical protein PLESTB_001627300 [Pleodorina starrii]|uniref:Mediator of RNA polymerase II transcription subunit 18 n=1 Tax=Pleodorina starrii TaxID=330485 RepID=A0A9W6BYF4_9CHLO|nr:hypothetical protein PLESTM_000911500 [Pleodorina starrii]GLC60564.1 hypothetical protein PLESTB_001627300 [Pleodorina starrii]GLC77144.1 hypothetical protein PLESTF_001891000 [Pleodorina starrii]